MAWSLRRAFAALTGPIPTSYLDDNFGQFANSTANSIAELRTRLIANSGGGAVVPLGYYAPFDGGGGFPFTPNVADTTSGCFFTGAVTPGAPTPAAPTLTQVASGAQGARTEYFKITYVTAAGETLASAEASIAVLANNVAVVTSPPATQGATGYNVYASTSSGTEGKQNAQPIAIGTNWQEPAGGLLIGVILVPTSNTAGSVLTVSAVTNGTVITGHRLSDVGGLTAVNSYVVGQITGTGGAGTYTLTGSGQTIASSVMVTDNGGTTLVAFDGGRWVVSPQGFATFRGFGATGGNTIDDTWAISSCIQTALSGGYKRIFAGQGNFKVTATITIPPYYNASLAAQLWGSVGQDFQLDFSHATITSSVPVGSTIFALTVGNYPSSRYFLDIIGGTFYSTTAVADVFRINGGSIWMCRFNGCSVPAATAPGAFVRLYNTDPTFEPGALSIRDVVVSADSVFTFDSAAGGLLFADNFTFDNIYHFGTLATSGTIRLLGSTGLISARISKIFQVGVGGIIYVPAGGYLSYSTLSDLYSESTTNNVNFVNAALQSCTMSQCRALVSNSTTQTVTWYSGQAIDCVFTNLHTVATNLSGAQPYNNAAYAYYPQIVLGGSSADNTIIGYNTQSYKNAVQGRTGGVTNAIGASDRAVLTNFDYTGTAISALGFVQAGNTIPQVQYLGSKYYLHVRLTGTASGAGAKTLGVELHIGAATFELGADISITGGQWKAEARFSVTFVSGSTYAVVMPYGESWSGNTVGSGSIASTNVNSTDAISFGLNVKANAAGSVVIGDGSIEILRRFALYDSLT